MFAAGSHDVRRRHQAKPRDSSRHRAGSPSFTEGETPPPQTLTPPPHVGLITAASSLQDSYERAKNILKTYSKEHKKLADALLRYETLDAKEIQMVLEGKPLDH